MYLYPYSIFYKCWNKKKAQWGFPPQFLCQKKSTPCPWRGVVWSVWAGLISIFRFVLQWLGSYNEICLSFKSSIWCGFSSILKFISRFNCVIFSMTCDVFLHNKALFRLEMKIFWVSHRMCRKDVGRGF